MIQQENIKLHTKAKSFWILKEEVPKPLMWKNGSQENSPKISSATLVIQLVIVSIEFYYL